MNMKKGSLMIEALVALVIIILAAGMAFVPSGTLLKKAKENESMIELSEIALNKCEELIYKNVSSIVEEATNVYYNGKIYSISIKKVNNINKNNFVVKSSYDELIFKNYTSVIIKVSTNDGKYIETQVVPQQW